MQAAITISCSPESIRYSSNQLIIIFLQTCEGSSESEQGVELDGDEQTHKFDNQG